MVGMESQFVCFFCEERFSDKQRLMYHQDTCSMRSLGLQTLLRDKLPVRSSSKKRRFLEYFNVVSTRRAEVLRRRDTAEQVVCDVIVLDDSEDDEPQPLPKSLPSDGAKFQRSTSICHSVKKKNVVVIKKGSDTAVSSSAKNLLKIDICSFLGQRLRDHVGMLNTRKREPYENERTQPLSCSSALVHNVRCRSSSSSFSPVSPFIDKVGQNSECRVTFRPSRRSLYTHAYKFTRRQRKEFCRAFDCGLSKRSRRLLKRMKPCRVKLQKYCSKTSVPDSEVTSNQNSLVVQNRKSVVSLMRCDYQMTSYQTKPSLRESDMSECRIREAAVVRPTVDNSQCRVDREPPETVASAAPLTANESSVELEQQPTRVTSNFPSAHNATMSSDAGLNPTTSTNFVETVTQTTDSDFLTTDCASSMKEVQKNKMNSSRWSMNVDLPALSFLCNICSNVIECVNDAKLLIFDHYAGHGITNIDIREEITPSGERVIQLIELPVVKGNTSKTVISQASCLSTAASTSNSILRHAHSFLQAELGIDSAAAVVHPQKKGKRVTWSDELCNTVTQHQHRMSSVSCLDATHQDAMTGLSKRGLTSSTRQQTVILNNGSVSSEFCSSNNVTINTSVAPTTQVSGVGTQPSSSTFDESTPCSFAIRDSDMGLLKTASEHARMFWSNSDPGRTTTARGPPSTAEQPSTFRSPKPISTALPFQSKQSTNSMLLSGGAWDEYSDGVCCSLKSPPLIFDTPPSARHPGLSSRINSHTPQMTLNNCRQRDVICID